MVSKTPEGGLPTPEAPKVEKAPEAPEAKGPETAAELDGVGQQMEAFIKRTASEAKTAADKKFAQAPEGLGVAPEVAVQVAQETGIAQERAAASTELNKTAQEAVAEIDKQVGTVAEEKADKTAEQYKEFLGKLSNEVSEALKGAEIKNEKTAQFLEKKALSMKSGELPSFLFGTSLPSREDYVSESVKQERDSALKTINPEIGERKARELFQTGKYFDALSPEAATQIYRMVREREEEGQIKTKEVAAEFRQTYAQSFLNTAFEKNQKFRDELEKASKKPEYTNDAAIMRKLNSEFSEKLRQAHEMQRAIKEKELAARKGKEGH